MREECGLNTLAPYGRAALYFTLNCFDIIGPLFKGDDSSPVCPMSVGRIYPSASRPKELQEEGNSADGFGSGPKASFWAVSGVC